MQKKEHGRPSKENKGAKSAPFSGSHATAKALASVVKVFKKKQTLEKRY
jgi:hypothetical protein